MNEESTGAGIAGEAPSQPSGTARGLDNARVHVHLHHPLDLPMPDHPRSIPSSLPPTMSTRRADPCAN